MTITLADSYGAPTDEVVLKWTKSDGASSVGGDDKEKKKHEHARGDVPVLEASIPSGRRFLVTATLAPSPWAYAREVDTDRSAIEDSTTSQSGGALSESAGSVASPGAAGVGAKIGTHHVGSGGKKSASATHGMVMTAGGMSLGRNRDADLRKRGMVEQLHVVSADSAIIDYGSIGIGSNIGGSPADLDLSRRARRQSSAALVGTKSTKAVLGGTSSTPGAAAKLKIANHTADNLNPHAADRRDVIMAGSFMRRKHGWLTGAPKKIHCQMLRRTGNALIDKDIMVGHGASATLKGESFVLTPGSKGISSGKTYTFTPVVDTTESTGGWFRCVCHRL